MADNFVVKDGSGATITKASKDIGSGVQADKVLLVDSSGTALNTFAIDQSTPGATNRVAVSDGGDITQGAKADAAYAGGGGSASIVALIKGLYNAMVAPTPAGSNLMGSVSIDQTTPGTTNKVVAGVPDTAVSSYSVAGVIAINTDLITIDCTNVRGLLLNLVSMGTTGVATPQWSNDNTNWVNGYAYGPSGSASGNTVSTAGAYHLPVFGKFFRLRLTTATTAGTTTATIATTTTHIPSAMAVTVPQGVSLVTGSLLAADVGVQARATGTTPSIARIKSAASDNATNVKASAGKIFGWTLYNNTASVKVVKIYNKASTPTLTGTPDTPAFTIVIPPNASDKFMAGDLGITLATGIGYSITTQVADGSDATTTAADDVHGALLYL